jgi:large conductance mechanosensitive channel protein
MINDFKKFILRGNVVDLAVAVVIGAAFNSVVQSLVKDFITPLISPRAVDCSPALHLQLGRFSKHFAFILNRGYCCFLFSSSANQ